MKHLLYGRELTAPEWKGESGYLEQTNQRPGFELVEGRWQCQRCGTVEAKALVHGPCLCSEDCFYCSVCLNMGKVKKCGKLYSLPEENDFPIPTENPLKWEGVLSNEQARASADIVQTVQNKTRRLIWAVAGAGKTEMIFAGIAEALLKKERVCISSPRIDVCLELAPRLKAAFPSTPLAVLHGRMEEDYSYTPLVITTTHQLLRFKEAFDLLIIDEVDSFPYHNDLALRFGAEKARKKVSALLYLTATPSANMQKDVTREKLKATILPARYHRFPLPSVTCVWLGDWQKHIKEKNKRAKFLRLLDKKLAINRRLLIFLPQIDLMEVLENWLKARYPDKSFTSVSAEDPQRVEKVKNMRQESYDFILTTTILERGVTFRDIDVFVIGAENGIFTEASLVQIAGRVGRHKDFPTGDVYFGHFGQTKAMKRAVKQINNMNQRAREGGLLHDLPIL